MWTFEENTSELFKLIVFVVVVDDTLLPLRTTKNKQRLEGVRSSSESNLFLFHWIFHIFWCAPPWCGARTNERTIINDHIYIYKVCFDGNQFLLISLSFSLFTTGEPFLSIFIMMWIMFFSLLEWNVALIFVDCFSRLRYLKQIRMLRKFKIQAIKFRGCVIKVYGRRTQMHKNKSKRDISQKWVIRCKWWFIQTIFIYMCHKIMHTFLSLDSSSIDHCSLTAFAISIHIKYALKWFLRFKNVPTTDTLRAFIIIVTVLTRIAQLFIVEWKD